MDLEHNFLKYINTLSICFTSNTLRYYKMSTYVKFQCILIEHDIKPRKIIKGGEEKMVQCVFDHRFCVQKTILFVQLAISNP